MPAELELDDAARTFHKRQTEAFQIHLLREAERLAHNQRAPAIREDHINQAYQNVVGSPGRMYRWTRNLRKSLSSVGGFLLGIFAQNGIEILDRANSIQEVQFSLIYMLIGLAGVAFILLGVRDA